MSRVGIESVEIFGCGRACPFDLSSLQRTACAHGWPAIQLAPDGCIYSKSDGDVWVHLGSKMGPGAAFGDCGDRDSSRADISNSWFLLASTASSAAAPAVRSCARKTCDSLWLSMGLRIFSRLVGRSWAMAGWKLVTLSSQIKATAMAQNLWRRQCSNLAWHLASVVRDGAVQRRLGKLEGDPI